MTKIAWVLALLPLLAACATEEETTTDTTGDRLSELERQNAELTRENAALATRLKRTAETPAPPASSHPLGNTGVTVDNRPGETVVRIPADLFFRSGQHTMTASGREILDQVITMIKTSHPNGTIRVEGHADTDPIQKSNNHCNFELAYKRAHTVMHYMIETGKMPAGRLSLASYGENSPRDASNKAQNRRVEIVILKQ